MGNTETDDPTGKLFCWGDNKFWQLAIDPEKVKKSDNLIQAMNLKDLEMLDVKSGWSHGAALTSKLFCQGSIL